MDQRMLKLILESHILKSKVVLGQLYNGQRLETIGGKFLRVFIYRTVRPLLAGCHYTYTIWINHIIWPSILLSLTHDINLLSFTLWNISAGCVHWEFLSDKRQQGRKQRGPSSHEDFLETSGKKYVWHSDRKWRVQVSTEQC